MEGGCVGMCDGGGVEVGLGDRIRGWVSKWVGKWLSWEGVSVCNPFPLIFSRYRPTLAVSFISAELGFASDEECLSFLVNTGAVLDRESTKMDCKLTSSKLSSSG